MRGMRCHMNVSQLDVQRQVAVRIRHISRDHLTLCGQTQTEQYEVHDEAGHENHNMRWWPTIDGDGGDALQRARERKSVDGRLSSSGDGAEREQRGHLHHDTIVGSADLNVRLAEGICLCK